MSSNMTNVIPTSKEAAFILSRVPFQKALYPSLTMTCLTQSKVFLYFAASRLCILVLMLIRMEQAPAMPP